MISTPTFLKQPIPLLIRIQDIHTFTHKMSGLAINKDKTKVIKIGGSRDRRISWEGQFGLKWTHSFEVLVNQYDVFKLDEITELNLEIKMQKIKRLIRTWSTRKLIP